MSKEITLKEAAAAWGRGEMVEAEHDGEWRPVAPLGGIRHAFTYHSPEVFNRSFGRFRMASMPAPSVSTEITLEEAALAWAQGKKVEAKPEQSNQLLWGLIVPVGNGDGSYNANVFATTNKYIFRLAPEPKFRPWTMEEAPVGAFTRPKFGGDVLMIVGRRSSGALLAGDKGVYPFYDLLNLREHSIDPVGTPENKRTWLPCGVEVAS